jgi:alkylhydroperoxidase family enzyme
MNTDDFVKSDKAINEKRFFSEIIITEMRQLDWLLNEKTFEWAKTTSEILTAKVAIYELAEMILRSATKEVQCFNCMEVKV